MDEEYSIWLMPCVAEAKVLNRLIARMAPAFGTPAFGAHATVQGDLAMPRAVLGETLQVLARQTETLVCPIRALGVSPHFFRSLYLELEHSGAFDVLQDAAGLLTGCREGRSPFPHVSLGYGTPANLKYRQALLRLDAGRAATQCLHFDRLALVRSSKNVPIAAWEVLDSYALLPVA
jgi:hypothetical protein